MNTPRCLVLSDDLLFTSRLTTQAARRGIAVAVVSSVDKFAELVARHAPPCVVLDLHHPRLELESLLASLTPRPPRVVGYGSHVDAPTLSAARAAGVDPVWPRSKFAEEAGEALAGWVQEPEA